MPFFDDDDQNKIENEMIKEENVYNERETETVNWFFLMWKFWCKGANLKTAYFTDLLKKGI